MKGDMALIFCGARMSYDCSRSNENETKSLGTLSFKRSNKIYGFSFLDWHNGIKTEQTQDIYVDVFIFVFPSRIAKGQTKH